MFSSKKRLAAIFAVVVPVTLISVGSSPANGDPDPGKKVYVCKYVGTPGVDERLQTGQNPIEVSVNAAELSSWDGQSFGVFVDAHDRSYVLGFVPMTPEPTAADCPGPDNPPDEETIPVPELAELDPCGPDNAVYGEVPPGNYSVTRNEDRSITLVANDGYVFDGGETTVTLPVPDDSNEQCGGEVGVAGNVPVSSACEAITIGTPTVSPKDATAVIKLNGEVVEPNTYAVQPGVYRVMLFVNGENVSAERLTVKSCDKGDNGGNGGGDGNGGGHNPTPTDGLNSPAYANTGH